MATLKDEDCIHEYDIFLSFRGVDTRNGFTDHLYAALLRVGLRTFRDNNELERGESLNPQLEKAIKNSAASIIVFSPNYASSGWCLDEVEMILERKRNLQHYKVLPVFYKVEPHNVRYQKGSFEKAFRRHIEKDYVRLEKILAWRKALGEAANMSGMTLPKNGSEANFIDEIVSDINKKLQSERLYVSKQLVGIDGQAKDIVTWLQNESANDHILVLWGIGGIGKTTVAEYVYESNLRYFKDGGTCLAKIAQTFSNEPKGLLRLQNQLLSALTKGKEEKIREHLQGRNKIQKALCNKKVLIVLDDVTEATQLEELLKHFKFFLGSKVIITTRNKDLLKGIDVCYKLHEVKCLGDDDSLELFSRFSFRQDHPKEDFIRQSKEIVRRCGNLPLALRLLGSSLFEGDVDVWNDTLKKLEEVAHTGIQEVLKISYDSLKDDKNEKLFLWIACFFIGVEKGRVIELLDPCDLYPVEGMKKLIDRCLLTISSNTQLEMHPLIQDMGREIVRKQSPDVPGERSILWSDTDSYSVLKDNSGTKRVECLNLDMKKVEQEGSEGASLAVIDQEKALYGELIGYLKNKKHEIFGRLWSSDEGDLRLDAFSKMINLKIVKLNHVHLTGSCKNFPKRLRWICWRNCPLESIPCYLHMDNLVALDLIHSSLKQIWDGYKVLKSLKFLDLSNSQALEQTPDFRGIPKLERLILRGCTSLATISETIGELKQLVLLNLEDCRNLRAIPRFPYSIVDLEMSGCTGLGESTAKQQGEGDQPFYSRIVKYLSPRAARPVILLSTLPRSLVNLDLGGCNLTDNAFPEDFCQLSSLRNLDISRNLIRKLPDCVDTLDGIHRLCIMDCPVLQSVHLCHTTTLQDLELSSNRALQIVKVTPSNTKCSFRFFHNENLEEIEGCFKMTPIGKVDKKVKISLCLTTAMLSENTKVMYEFGIYSTYFRGREVLNFFLCRENGSNISAIIPPSLPDHLDSSIRGLNVTFAWRCQMYADKLHLYSSQGIVTLHNRTKDLRWIYAFELPQGEHGKDYTWVSFWKCRDLLEGGDEIRALIQLEGTNEVMECGLRIFYDDTTDSYEDFSVKFHHQGYDKFDAGPVHIFADYGESEENASFDDDDDGDGDGDGDDDDDDDYEEVDERLKPLMKALARLSRAKTRGIQGNRDNNDHEEEEDDKNENEETEIHNNDMGVRHIDYDHNQFVDDHNAIEEDEEHSHGKIKYSYHYFTPPPISSHHGIRWTDEMLVNFSDSRTPGITYCFSGTPLSVHGEDIQDFNWWGPLSADYPSAEALKSVYWHGEPSMMIVSRPDDRV